MLKYDQEIPRDEKSRTPNEVFKGYYYTERELVKLVKEKVLGVKSFRGRFKTVECCIMDVADDIAYSTYDVEDAFKASFLTPLSMISAPPELLERVAAKVDKRLGRPTVTFRSDDVVNTLLSLFGEIFDLSSYGITRDDLASADDAAASAIISSAAHTTSVRLASDGYFRTDLTSQLVGQFIRGVSVDPDPKYPALTRVYLDDETLKKVEVLKNFAYEALIMAPMLKVAEYRGRDIVQNIFMALQDEKGHLLMPDDLREIYDDIYGPSEKARVICDFIAGMTDRYALEFHGRLYSVSAESIWKPI